MKKFPLFLLVMTLVFSVATVQAQKEKPNIVLILADDLGYADLGTYGAPKIETPRLDKMAEQGMKFTDFYVANLCSPTRAELMTGSYAYRIGVRQVFWPDSKVGLNPDEITIAELLKQEGYTTGAIGKWHLGHKKPFLPTNQGFDYYFGLPFSNDMGPNARPAKGPYDPLPIMRNEEVIERGPDQSMLTKRYTEEAVQFIRKNKKNPFFLYLPHTMPHVPLHASDEFKGKSDFGLYGDVVEEIDWSTGRILDTLDELGLTENTLVIFLSDNGPWLQKGKEGGLATPFRNGKGTAWEGGHRVPAIMKWPGHVPSGVTREAMVSGLDLYPTIAELVGAEVPQDRVIDGKSFLPLLTGKTMESPRDKYFYYRIRKLQAVRVGDWKLHLEGTRKDYNNVRYNYSDEFDYHQNTELYNLEEDPGEQRNLVLEYPEKVKQLKKAVEKHKENIESNSRPLGSVDK